MTNQIKTLNNRQLLIELNLHDTFVNPWNFGHDDFFALDALSRFVNPNRKSLEIGTCKGYSTAIIAKNTHHLTTVDVHPNRLYKINPMQAAESPSIDEIGMHAFEFNNVTQILTDSSNLSKVLGTQYDFIFIDGSHDREHVEEDTMFAMRHITPGGVICWHDYNNVQDVTDYLNDWGVNMYTGNIYHAGQWCAFTQVD